MIPVASAATTAHLHGTPKQVSFALHIRDQLLPEIEQMRDDVAHRLRYGIVAEDDQPGLMAIVRAADCVARVDRADWWIRQQGRSVHTILAENGRRILQMEPSS
jgi:hypothetical protein